MSIKNDYFYGTEAEQFAFYRIPKLLITSPAFKKVSDGAKLLYGLMLDRMCLSIKNNWIDENNRAYIFFTTNDVMEQMNCGTEKATKMINELEKGIRLIERKKQGQGKPALVYLKKFYINDDDHRKCRLSEIESQDFGKSKVKTFENRNSRVSETEIQDFRKSKSNNTNISNTDISDTEYSNTEFNETDFNNHILSYPIRNEDICDNGSSETLDAIGWMRERKTYDNLIKDNIDYDIMIDKFEKGWIDEIVELMVDVVCSREQYIRINKQEYPHEVVKSRFLKIDSSHIEYIYFALRENCSNVRNIRAFLITTIYRSFETSDNWFSAKVNYDMANPKKN